MSQFDNKKAAALKYDGGSKAPIVVAAGSGYVAQKIIDVAQVNDVPVYQDNSLATLLAQLKVGSEIPPELYQAIVEIYVYFLKYLPEKNKKKAADYKETPKNASEMSSESHTLDILSVPDIKISDLDTSEAQPKEKDTFTLDELRAENDVSNLDLNLLEDLIEEF